MKWKSTLGLIGTSEKVTPLKSAPMYSAKSLEFAAVETEGDKRTRKKWRRKRGERRLIEFECGDIG